MTVTYNLEGGGTAILSHGSVFNPPTSVVSFGSKYTSDALCDLCLNNPQYSERGSLRCLRARGIRHLLRTRYGDQHRLRHLRHTDGAISHRRRESKSASLLSCETLTVDEL